MKKLILEECGNVMNITLNVYSYREGNLAITMDRWNGNKPEEWKTLTVNLSGIRDKDCAFIDTNNNGQSILAWILRNGLGVPTGRRAQSGFCVYPEYRFRESMLKEQDSEGYETYMKGLK